MPHRCCCQQGFVWTQPVTVSAALESLLGYSESMLWWCLPIAAAFSLAYCGAKEGLGEGGGEAGKAGGCPLLPSSLQRRARCRPTPLPAPWRLQRHQPCC